MGDEFDRTPTPIRSEWLEWIDTLRTRIPPLGMPASILEGKRPTEALVLHKKEPTDG